MDSCPRKEVSGASLVLGPSTNQVGEEDEMSQRDWIRS